MKKETLAVVIIGRNEGQRLIDCLNSLSQYQSNVFYVDSASTDDSISQAKKYGAQVVELDMSKPFTAARARNAGVISAANLFPNLQYVQFLDGDCVVNANWIETATVYLDSHLNVAVVCGRRRERYPCATIYNKFCDIEWNTPIGQAKACGGDALMRFEVFNAVGGYKETLIAGEEPELCVRIRQAGHLIWRLDEEMTLHDAAITRFSQWWKRSMRAGYAFAEGTFLHGDPPEYHWVAESWRARLWAGILPLCILLCAFSQPVLSFMLLLLYPLQIIRLTLKSREYLKFAFAQAFFTVIGKFAELQGQLKFFYYRSKKQNSSIIEYK